MHRTVVRGIETGSTRRYGLEPGHQDPVLQRCIGKFQEEKIDKRNRQQDRCRNQNQFGLQTQAFITELVGQQVAPGQKTGTADDDQGTDHEIDPWMGSVAGQRRKRTSDTHQVKTGIAESRYRMKDGIAQSFEEAEVFHEHR